MAVLPTVTAVLLHHSVRNACPDSIFVSTG